VASGSKDCKNACLNGGKCKDSLCICKSPWQGEFCEISQAETRGIFHFIFLFLLVSLIISVFTAVVYFYYHPERLPQKIHDFLSKNAKWVLRSEEI
jgi:hypothetical protein